MKNSAKLLNFQNYNDIFALNYIKKTVYDEMKYIIDQKEHERSLYNNKIEKIFQKHIINKSEGTKLQYFRIFKEDFYYSQNFRNISESFKTNFSFYSALALLINQVFGIDLSLKISSPTKKMKNSSYFIFSFDLFVDFKKINIYCMNCETKKSAQNILSCFLLKKISPFLFEYLLIVYYEENDLIEKKFIDQLKKEESNCIKNENGIVSNLKLEDNPIKIYFDIKEQVKTEIIIKNEHSIKSPLNLNKIEKEILNYNNKWLKKKVTKSDFFLPNFNLNHLINKKIEKNQNKGECKKKKIFKITGKQEMKVNQNKLCQKISEENNLDFWKENKEDKAGDVKLEEKEKNNQIITEKLQNNISINGMNKEIINDTSKEKFISNSKKGVFDYKLNTSGLFISPKKKKKYQRGNPDKNHSKILELFYSRKKEKEKNQIRNTQNDINELRMNFNKKVDLINYLKKANVRILTKNSEIFKEFEELKKDNQLILMRETYQNNIFGVILHTKLNIIKNIFCKNDFNIKKSFFEYYKNHENINFYLQKIIKNQKRILNLNISKNTFFQISFSNINKKSSYFLIIDFFETFYNPVFLYLKETFLIIEKFIQEAKLSHQKIKVSIK